MSPPPRPASPRAMGPGPGCRRRRRLLPAPRPPLPGEGAPGFSGPGRRGAAGGGAASGAPARAGAGAGARAAAGSPAPPSPSWASSPDWGAQRARPVGPRRGPWPARCDLRRAGAQLCWGLRPSASPSPGRRGPSIWAACFWVCLFVCLWVSGSLSASGSLFSAAASGSPTSRFQAHWRQIQGLRFCPMTPSCHLSQSIPAQVLA